ncbi:hypothetical protein BD309DRAFT_58267 [Dichomitus squalens]|nr:hypothetical protein BD309DRAFT_58267 [Dichomitus squalens]
MPLDLALQSLEICGALEELRSHSLVFSGASDRVPSLSPRGALEGELDHARPAGPRSSRLPRVSASCRDSGCPSRLARPLWSTSTFKSTSPPPARPADVCHLSCIPRGPSLPHPHTHARDRRLPPPRVLRVLRAGRRHARVRQRQRARRAHVRVRHICALLACADVPETLTAHLPLRSLRVLRSDAIPWRSGVVGPMIGAGLCVRACGKRGGRRGWRSCTSRRTGARAGGPARRGAAPRGHGGGRTFRGRARWWTSPLCARCERPRALRPRRFGLYTGRGRQ